MSFTESLGQLVCDNRNGLLSGASHWERIRLGDIASIVNGFPFPSSSFSRQQGVPLLRIRDVLNDRTEAFLDGKVDVEYLVDRGDLIVGMDGDFNAALWKGPRAALNQRVCKISPNEAFYDRTFLSYVLPGYLRAINASTSSVTVKHLSSKTVAEIPLPLPPRGEQRRIVAAIEQYLSDLDAACAALERVRAALPRYRAAVLKAAWDGSLNEATADEWTEVPLGKLVNGDGLFTDGDWVESKDQDPHGDVRLIQLADIGDGEYRNRSARFLTKQKAAELGCTFLRPGDLLIARMPDPLGRACIFPGDARTSVTVVDVCILRTGESGVDHRWLMHSLNSPVFRSRVAALQSGSTRKRISRSNLAAIPVHVPPRRQQLQIRLEVDRRLSLGDAVECAIEAGLAKAKRLRQAILKRAFEGKLVPQDPNDEPASVLLERIRATHKVRAQKA